MQTGHGSPGLFVRLDKRADAASGEVEVSGQKKRIGLLCLLVVVGGGWVALASRYSSEHAPASTQAPTVETSFLSDPNLASADSAGLGGRELFLKMMLSIGLVLGLGAAALYLSKRVLPKVTNAPGKEIRVVETSYLGPRKALHLIEVGNQRLLIASTNDRITTLAHLNDAWLDEDVKYQEAEAQGIPSLRRQSLDS
jgi:flagellar biosynthetic protein FliO